MCEITHCLQRYTGVRSPFRVDREKNSSQSIFFTLAPLLMLLTNIRYAKDICIIKIYDHDHDGHDDQKRGLK